MFLYIVCTKVPLVYLQAFELTLIPEKLNHTFATVDLSPNATTCTLWTLWSPLPVVAEV
jgi:hypothetical protein